MNNQKLDTYLNLCTQVYELSKPNPLPNAYAFYRSYVAEANGSILEPMCGTGRFLLPLLAEGFNVHGFDASKHMLDALHAKAKLQNLNPTVWEGFVENLDRQQKYNLIFIPSGSFGLITSLNAAKQALATFYNHLSPDGVLVFEAETLQSAPKQFVIWNGSVWRRQDNKMIIMNSLALPIESNISTHICKYELIDGDNIVQTEVEDFKVRLWEPENLINMLEEVGFKDIKLVKAFDKSKEYERNDEVIVYECRK